MFGRQRTRVVYWEAYDLVYLRVPKSGNRSIRSSIPHPEHRSVDITRLREIFPGSRSFSFVRNPWARLVSTWAAKIRPPDYNTRTIIEGVHHGFIKAGLPVRAGMPFDEFAEIACATPDSKTDKHLRSQSYFVVRDGAIVPEFLGRLETLADDWARLAAMVGITEEMRHLNNNPPGRYTKRYDARLRNLVGDRYRQDVEIFGYEFGA